MGAVCQDGMHYIAMGKEMLLTTSSIDTCKHINKST